MHLFPASREKFGLSTVTSAVRGPRLVVRSGESREERARSTKKSEGNEERGVQASGRRSDWTGTLLLQDQAVPQHGPAAS